MRSTRLREEVSNAAISSDFDRAAFLANPKAAAIGKAIELMTYTPNREIFWFHTEHGFPAFSLESQIPNERFEVEVVFAMPMRKDELPSVSIKDASSEYVIYSDPDLNNQGDEADEVQVLIPSLRQAIQLQVRKRLQSTIAEFHALLVDLPDRRPGLEVLPEDCASAAETVPTSNTSVIPELDYNWYEPHALVAACVRLAAEARHHFRERFLEKMPVADIQASSGYGFLDREFQRVYEASNGFKFEESFRAIASLTEERLSQVLDGKPWWSEFPNIFSHSFNDVFMCLQMHMGIKGDPPEESRELRLYAQYGPFLEDIKVPLLLPLFEELERRKDLGLIEDTMPMETRLRRNWVSNDNDE